MTNEQVALLAAATSHPKMWEADLLERADHFLDWLNERTTTTSPAPSLVGVKGDEVGGANP